MNRWIAAVALLVALTGSAQEKPAPESAPKAAPVYSPLVDYHQHLASPAGAALLNRALPPVTLPPAIEQVMTTMTAHWNEPAALVPLYTDDVIVLANKQDTRRGFVRGAKAAGEYAGTLYGRPYRITPVIYAPEGNRAQVAGYFTRGEGDAARNFGYFYFVLVKQADDSWRIAADTRSFDPRPSYFQEPISGQQLLGLLDEAGIRQAVVLSDAYWFDSPEYVWPTETPAEIYAHVRAENDWTAQQALASGGRLIAFCSFNPLADHALKELERCAAGGVFRGLKLHLQMAGVDLHDPAHVAKVRQVFAAADRLRFPIIVHAQTVTNYDRAAAQIFLDQVVSAAPHILVTIAHLWGGGPFAAEPLAVYTSAVAAGHPSTRNLYFDVAEAALVAGDSVELRQAIADAIRRIGPRRVVFGSDAVGQSALAPLAATTQFRQNIPLTEEEFATIAANVLPYLRPR
ncbi:MAG TPA: amidohydrolase family protein [Thermoanaerobaculia bacterium]|jgi:predicted TIM-barrel fold metal-dependent hydrolase